MEESRRTAPEVINGQAPSDQALEPLPGVSFAPLEFDPREFMHLVESEGLSEQEAAMLLRAIWDVMVAFLDLQLGIHPISQVVDHPEKVASTSRQAKPAMISSKEAFSLTTGSTLAARTTRGKRVK